MKHFIILLLLPICFVATAFGQHCETEEETMASLPAGLSLHTAANYQDETIYVVSGYNANISDWDDAVYAYSIADDQWESAPPIPTARAEACNTGMIDGLGQFCVIGGNLTGTPQVKVECFDIMEDEWKPGPDLPQALTGVYCAVYEDVVYVTGGYTGAGFSNAFYTWDTAAKADWENQGSSPVAAAFGFGAINRKFTDERPFFVTYLGEKAGSQAAETQVYDIENGTWEAGTSIGIRYRYPAGVTFDQQQTLLMGGTDLTGTPTPDEVIRSYDLDLGEWVTATDVLETARGNAAAVVVGDEDDERIFLMGGFTGVFTAQSNVVLGFWRCRPRFDDVDPDEVDEGVETPITLSGARFALSVKLSLGLAGSIVYEQEDMEPDDEGSATVTIPATLDTGVYDLRFRNYNSSLYGFRMNALAIGTELPEDDDSGDDDTGDEDDEDDKDDDDDEACGDMGCGCAGGCSG